MELITPRLALHASIPVADDDESVICLFFSLASLAAEFVANITAMDPVLSFFVVRVRKLHE